MIRYFAREYFYKTVFSTRFIILTLVLLISIYSLFHPMAVRLVENGYQVGALELLPCLLFSSVLVATYFIPFVFLIMAYPSWDGALNQIIRLGKRKWMMLQYIYVGMTSVLYYLIWTAAFILAFLPCISWKNEWSSFMLLATDANKVSLTWDLLANVNLYFSPELLPQSPLAVWGLTFLLHVLGCVFVGIVALIFNVYFRRGAGTILAFFIATCRTIIRAIP